MPTTRSTRPAPATVPAAAVAAPPFPPPPPFEVPAGLGGFDRDVVTTRR